jgi:LysR family glycine cleavage system transcriptional activator
LLIGEISRQGQLVAPFATMVEGPQSYWVLWCEGAPAPHFVEWLVQQFSGQGARKAAPPR